MLKFHKNSESTNSIFTPASPASPGKKNQWGSRTDHLVPDKRSVPKDSKERFPDQRPVDSSCRESHSPTQSAENGLEDSEGWWTLAVGPRESSMLFDQHSNDFDPPLVLTKFCCKNWSRRWTGRRLFHQSLHLVYQRLTYSWTRHSEGGMARGLAPTTGSALRTGLAGI